MFYFIIIDEINDETDDALEDYSDHIIQRFLAGEQLPAKDNGTNNTYYIIEVKPEYATVNKQISYSEDMMYLESKNEYEPARVYKAIFRNKDNRYFELTVAIPTIEKADLQLTILWWTVGIYLLLMLAIIIINAWIISGNFKPLYRLLEWLKHYEIDKQIPPLNNPTRTTEFAELNKAILQSADRNNEIYEQQKNFIGNASHELQTPLAVCLNRLEMLTEDESLTDKQMEEIEKVRRTLNQTVKLNKILLLLSKIENGQIPEPEDVNINVLIADLLESYRDVFDYKSIEVSIRETDTLHLNMNRGLASAMFSNLLKNAFIHTTTGGRIEIEIQSDWFVISNTSSVEAPLPADKIFERFYKGNNSEGNSGLGLSLVASIAKLYDYVISYNYLTKKSMHSFSVAVKPSPRKG
jgi:signal transduction histidine kinase